MSGVEVRGHSRVEQRAPMLLRFLAGVFDLALGFFLLEVCYLVFSVPPCLDWKIPTGLAVCSLIPWALSRWLLKASLGEKVWRIQGQKTQLRESSDEVRGIFLTAAIYAGCLLVFALKISSHPYWSTAESLHIRAEVPPSDWRVLAFYYTLAPWPVAMNGTPVFYSIPYEMGPPKRFVGHVTANWIKDSVRVTFEGPKTPQEYQSRVRNRRSVQECFSRSPIFSPSCVEVRRLTVERHLDELQAEGYAKFEVSWFSAENPGIPEAQQAQGVLLRGSNGEKIEERYILITPLGIHQSIALSYLDNAEGRSAKAQFEIALGALRISEDLNQGRAWMDQLLGSTRLKELPPVSSPEYLQSLASVQSMLVSKLSVDPSAYDAYYHLAGSNFLLLKYTIKNPDPELKSQAQAMVQRMNRFAHDVSSANARNGELDRLLQDSKQF